MFQEKFKKGIASLLIVCMTISSNGFASLAGSSEGAISAAGQAGSQENSTNYYYEYQQEMIMNAGKSQDSLNNFGDAGDAANAENSEEKENITLDGEDEQSTINSSNTNDVDDLSDDSSTDNDTIGDLSPDSFIAENNNNNNSNKNNYQDEPEEDVAHDNNTSDNDVNPSDIADNNNAENNTDNNEQGSSSAQDETENTESTTETVDSSEKETTTTTTEQSTETTQQTTTQEESSVSTSETTTNIQTSQSSDGDIATESETEIVKEEQEENKTNKETENKTKKYVRATENDADVFNDGRKHEFRIKQILLDSKDGSIDRAVSCEELDDKFLAKSIKILLVDQFGNEKLVRVNAKWNHDFYDLSDEHHVAVKAEKEQQREEEKKKEKELVLDDAEYEKIKESKAEVDEESDKESHIEEESSIDETVAGFTNTNDDFDDFIDNEPISISVDTDELDGEEVVRVFGNGENDEVEEAVLGEVANGTLNENNADSVIVNSLDEQSLIESLAEELSDLGTEFTIVIDKDELDDCNTNIFGATAQHGPHCVCGLDSCDKGHYLFDLNSYGTYDVTSKVQSEEHPSMNFNELAATNTAQYFTNGGSWALTADLTINEVYVINGTLRLCLNGNNLQFSDGGKLSLESSNGSLYICNCKQTVSHIKGNASSFRSADAGSAIEINTAGNCFIYGTDYSGTRNIQIHDFKNIESADSGFDVNKNRAAGFLHVGKYAKKDATGNIIGYEQPSARIVSICDVEASNCYGYNGGFVWAESVNSFMSINVKITQCYAARGSAYAVDYYQSPNSSSGNEYLLFLKNEVSDCGNYLSDLSTTTEKYQDYFKSEEPNGIVVFNNYSSVQDVVYRQIRGNKITNNIVRGNASAFHFNSSAEKSTDFLGNIITNNWNMSTADDELVIGDNTRLDLSSAATGVTFSSSPADKPRGMINFSGNIISKNANNMASTKAGAGGVAFINVDTVNLNDATDLQTDDGIHQKPVIENNFSRNRGAGALFQNVKSLYAQTTIFKNNVCMNLDATRDRSGIVGEKDDIDRTNVDNCYGGAAAFLYDVETVRIGYNGFKNERNIMEFIDNTSRYQGGAIAAYGTNTQRPTQQMNLWEGKYEGNVCGWNATSIQKDGNDIKLNGLYANNGTDVPFQENKGGALYVNGVYSVTINGSHFNKNLAAIGSAIHIQDANSFATSFYEVTTEVTEIKNCGKMDDIDTQTRFCGLGSSVSADNDVYKNCHNTGALAIVDVGSKSAGNTDVDLAYLDIENCYAMYRAGAIRIYDTRKANGSSSDVFDVVQITNTDIISNQASYTYLSDGGAIYNDGYELILGENTNIKQNANAIWLGSFANLTMKYNRTQRGTSEAAASDIGKAIITENTGDYVIGFVYGDSESDQDKKIRLFGGSIYANNLTQMQGIQNWNIHSQNNTVRAGIFESRGGSTGTPVPVSLIFGGAIEVQKNKRDGSAYNQDIPLEQTADGSHRFNIILSTDADTKLYHNCIIAMTPFNNSYETDGKAKEYRLFHGDNGAQDFEFTETWIEGVSDSGVPSEMFINDRENDDNDKRKIYAEIKADGTTGKVSLIHEDHLFGYEFDMLNHKDDMEPFSSQYIRKTGGSLFRPAEPNALSTDGALRYNDSNTVRAFDIMGYRGDSNTQRFTPWDFSQPTQPDTEDPTKHPGLLYVIYQLMIILQ